MYIFLLQGHCQSKPCAIGQLDESYPSKESQCELTAPYSTQEYPPHHRMVTHSHNTPSASDIPKVDFVKKWTFCVTSFFVYSNIFAFWL